MIIQAVLDIQLCELSRRLRFSRFYWIKRLTKSEYKVLEFSAWDKCTSCSLTNRKVCLGGRHVHVSQLPLFWAWYINRNERHQASPFFSKSLIGGFVICLKTRLIYNVMILINIQELYWHHQEGKLFLLLRKHQHSMFQACNWDTEWHGITTSWHQNVHVSLWHVLLKCWTWSLMVAPVG